MFVFCSWEGTGNGIRSLGLGAAEQEIAAGRVTPLTAIALVGRLEGEGRTGMKKYLLPWLPNRLPGRDDVLPAARLLKIWWVIGLVLNCLIFVFVQKLGFLAEWRGIAIFF